VLFRSESNVATLPDAAVFVPESEHAVANKNKQAEMGSKIFLMVQS